MVIKGLETGSQKAIRFLHSSIAPPAIVRLRRKAHVGPNKATDIPKLTETQECMKWLFLT